MCAIEDTNYAKSLRRRFADIERISHMLTEGKVRLTLKYHPSESFLYAGTTNNCFLTLVLAEGQGGDVASADPGDIVLTDSE